MPPLLKLGGLSINPSYTGIQDPVIQEFLNVDLVALATTASALVGNDAIGQSVGRAATEPAAANLTHSRRGRCISD